MFVDMLENFKFKGKLDILNDGEKEELDISLDNNTGILMPNYDVVLCGISNKGDSLVVVPKTNEIDFRNHGVTGMNYLIRVHLHGNY